MYQALFKITNPDDKHYPSVVNEGIASLNGVCNVSLNTFSHMFVVHYEHEKINTDTLKKFATENGVYCELKWNHFQLSPSVKKQVINLSKVAILRLFISSLFLCFSLFVHSSMTQIIILAIIAVSSIDFFKLSKQVPTHFSFWPKLAIFLSVLCHLICWYIREPINIFTLFFGIGLATSALAIKVYIDAISDSPKTHKEFPENNFAKIIKESAEIVEVPQETILGGELILVEPGEEFPTDGSIASGFTIVDESWINGKTDRIYKKEGKDVLGGSTNLSNRVVILASKPKTESLEFLVSKSTIDVFTSNKFTHINYNVKSWKISIIAASILVLGLSTVIYINGQTSLGKMVTLLEASIPFSALWSSAIMEVLTYLYAIKNNIFLKTRSLGSFQKIKTVFFTKTFLTQKNPVLNDCFFTNVARFDVTFQPQFSKGSIILMAAGIQSRCNLSYAQSLFEAYVSNCFSNNPEEAIESITSLMTFPEIDPEHGAEAIFKGSYLLMGTPNWIASKGNVDIKSVKDWTEAKTIKGERVQVLAIDNVIVAMFSFSDVLNRSATDIIDAIRAANCEPFLCVTTTKHEGTLSIAESLMIKRVCEHEIDMKVHEKTRMFIHTEPREWENFQEDAIHCTTSKNIFHKSKSKWIDAYIDSGTSIGVTIQVINRITTLKKMCIIMSFSLSLFMLIPAIFVDWIYLFAPIFQIIGSLLIGISVMCSFTKHKKSSQK